MHTIDLSDRLPTLPEFFVISRHAPLDSTDVEDLSGEEREIATARGVNDAEFSCGCGSYDSAASAALVAVELNRRHPETHFFVVGSAAIIDSPR